MRTFSALRALCSHPELIDRPSKRRDDAAAIGTAFHKAVERWAFSLDGEPRAEEYPEPVRGWLERMASFWTPPESLECEVAVGLADDVAPSYVEVRETEPHVYVPLNSERKLLTAGRADLVWWHDVSTLTVVDIKTGQSYLGDPWEVRQIMAQGIACALRGGASFLRLGVYYARLGVFDYGSRREIKVGGEEWATMWKHVADAARMTSEPQPGGWCLSCWSKTHCSANPERAPIGRREQAA